MLEDEHSTSEAITYLNQAVKFEPLNYNALIGLSKSYEKKGLMDNAIDYCFRALERPESHVNTKYYLVEIIAYSGKSLYEEEGFQKSY